MAEVIAQRRPGDDAAGGGNADDKEEQRQILLLLRRERDDAVRVAEELREKIEAMDGAARELLRAVSSAPYEGGDNNTNGGAGDSSARHRPEENNDGDGDEAAASSRRSSSYASYSVREEDEIFDSMQKTWRLEQTCLPSLLSACRMMRDSRNLLAREADQALDEVRAANDAARLAEEKLTKSKKALMKVYKENKKLRRENDGLRAKMNEMRLDSARALDEMRAGKDKEIDEIYSVIAHEEALWSSRNSLPCGTVEGELLPELKSPAASMAEPFESGNPQLDVTAAPEVSTPKPKTPQQQQLDSADTPKKHLSGSSHPLLSPSNPNAASMNFDAADLSAIFESAPTDDDPNNNSAGAGVHPLKKKMKTEEEKANNTNESGTPAQQHVQHVQFAKHARTLSGSTANVQFAKHARSLSGAANFQFEDATPKVGDLIAKYANRHREQRRHTYDITFRDSKNIGLKLHSLPINPTDGDSSTSATAAADSNAVTPRKKGRLKGKFSRRSKQQPDAIIVWGFRRVSTCNAANRPTLGARIVAVDGVSVEKGEWGNLKELCRRVRAMDGPVTISFRNDPVTAEQVDHLNRCLTKAPKHLGTGSSGGGAPAAEATTMMMPSSVGGGKRGRGHVRAVSAFT